jgi:hypothetical protein
MVSSAVFAVEGGTIGGAEWMRHWQGAGQPRVVRGIVLERVSKDGVERMLAPSADRRRPDRAGQEATV